MWNTLLTPRIAITLVSLIVCKLLLSALGGWMPHSGLERFLLEAVLYGLVLFLAGAMLVAWDRLRR